MVEGDIQASVEFLKRFYPEGPWVLTSIDPDRKGITTQTFWPKSDEALKSWLERYIGKRNIYFSVNVPDRDLNKKAEREDIKEMAWLHVDIDPRAGEDLETEKKRALALLLDPPGNVPPPTVIVFSGGGYQGFWRLEEPVPIRGDLANAEDAKRYNMQLELLFGADNCHNIDRIMRLPGTINVPDARKRKKGRLPALAELVEFHDDRTYPLERFTPAQAVQLKGETGLSGSATTVRVSGNIQRLRDIDDLDEWNVPDRVKVIIVQGRHPDETKAGDNSRSAWVFDCCCQLVRCDVPTEVIYSVLTDPDFGISESILEKGSNAEKYALRQIERAREEAVNPWLRRLNERHAVISNVGGKCRIVEEVFDHALGRARLTRQSFDDFRNRYMHEKVLLFTDQTGKAHYAPLGKWWLEQAQRRQFDTIVFAPGHEVPNAYNLWKGFAFQALPGTKHLGFLDHVKRNICSGNEEHFRYLIGWMARAIQNPDSPGMVSVVLRGGQGTGKGFLCTHFGRLWGRHFMQVSDPKHLVGSFNSHLRDCVVLFADEAFYAGDKKHESILKTLVTEETIQIEAKGVDVETAVNCLHIMMASNSTWVVPANTDERRYFVLDVGDEQKQNSGYFKALAEELKNGGYENLLHFLLSYDLSEFDVRLVPKTAALQEQKIFSLEPEVEWWYQKLQNGSLLFDHIQWETEVPCADLQLDYVDHLKAVGIARRATPTALGRFLKRVLPSGYPRNYQKLVRKSVPTDDGWSREIQVRPRFYGLPTLDAARACFDKLYDLNTEWLTPTTGAELPMAPAESESGTPF